MERNIKISELIQLSLAERIQLVEDVWDSIAQMPQALPLSEDEKSELDRRYHQYQSDSSKGSLWSDVRQNLLSKE